MPVSGSMSSAAVMRSLRNVVREWSMTVLGAGVLIVLSVSSFQTIYRAQGFGSQPTLSVADNDTLARVAARPLSGAVDTQQLVPITKPQRLLLPSINVALNVTDSTIAMTTNEWPLSMSDAHYANFTPGLGNKKGTLLLYGHATESVLGRTSSLKVGDPLTLIDEHNQAWEFVLAHEENIVPENVNFIYEDVPFRVAVFTCHGWNNQYRHLMYFNPKPTM